ncbi:MAG TPA: histidine phosphatase family protein [Allosphingosinicella sp.]|jgi:phosphohistidine phosphatase
MKTLTLLRHAKSSWNDVTERDFERPLNARGRRAAQTIGREMLSLGLSFDQVLASPATRVVETLREVEGGYGRELGTHFDKRIYLASTDTLLEIVQAADDQTRSVLLVGHNPGLESLVMLLAGDSPLRAEVAVKYPTATLAELSFECESWTDVRQGSGNLARFIRPRDLDPELGPDEES